MKWLGAHVWTLITKFYGPVHLPGVEEEEDDGKYLHIADGYKLGWMSATSFKAALGIADNEIIDWTVDQGATNIHANNYTNTTYSAGDLLDLSTTTFNVDLSELTDGTADVVGSTDELVYLDNGVQKRKQIDEIKLGQFNNDQSWTSNTGDITRVSISADDENNVLVNSGNADFPLIGGEGITTSIDSTDVVISAELATTSNKGVASFDTNDFSVSSGAVSLRDLSTSHIAAGTLVIESEGIGSNDNDTTIPTSAAVKDYADTNRKTSRIRFVTANFKDDMGTTETFIPLAAVPEEKTGFTNEQSAIIMPTSGYVKEVIVRAHYPSGYTSENIVIKVYNRAKNKKMNGQSQVGSDITIAAPTQNTTDDNNTRSTGDLGTSYPWSKWDALGMSFTWQSTGPTGTSDKTYITVVLQENITDLGY